MQNALKKNTKKSMEVIKFKNKVEELLEGIKQTLTVKGIEYMRNEDPFHNFNVGSDITGTNPFEVLDGFLLKHYVSYRDMLNDIKEGKYPKKEVVNEKLGDIITYFVLQKIMLENAVEKQDKPKSLFNVGDIFMSRLTGRKHYILKIEDEVHICVKSSIHNSQGMTYTDIEGVNKNITNGNWTKINQNG